MSEDRVYTAALIVIGDEILSGRTRDSNVQQLAQWLNGEGIVLAEARVVADDAAAIGAAIHALQPRHDYLFTTGGIGPTHDDITVDAIAAALGMPVTVDPHARAILEAHYADRGGVTAARLRMARVPDGATLIENPRSGAPGIRIGNIFILAGVPAIAGAMLEALAGHLPGGRRTLSRAIGCWCAESEVAELLRVTEAAHRACRIGSYPFFREGRTGANFVVRSSDAMALSRCIADLSSRLEQAGETVVPDGIAVAVS